MIQKEMIKQYLLQVLNGAKLASAGTEIVCPCPFCGDPRPKFYVGPFDDSDHSITYNCFLCKAHGFVSQDFLDSIKVSVAIDPEVLKSSFATSGVAVAVRAMTLAPIRSLISPI